MKKIIPIFITLSIFLLNVSTIFASDDREFDIYELDLANVVEIFEYQNQHLVIFGENDSNLAFSIYDGDGYVVEYHREGNYIYEIKAPGKTLIAIGGADWSSNESSSIGLLDGENEIDFAVSVWSPVTTTLSARFSIANQTTAALTIAGTIVSYIPHSLGIPASRVQKPAAYLASNFIANQFYYEKIDIKSYIGCSILYYYSNERLYYANHINGVWSAGTLKKQDTGGGHKWHGDPTDYSYPAVCRIAVQTYGYN